MADASAKQAATTTTTEEVGLLDQLLQETKPRSAEEKDRNKQFIDAVVREASKAGRTMSSDMTRNIKSWISEIDQRLSAQTNEILHHAEFQKLEGSWRGLHYLVHQSETGENLKIRVLNVTRKALIKDFEKAVEWDQSVLFKKVYEAEYGILGGQPYGLLVGDYEFGNHPTDDIFLLKQMAGVAAAAHAPFVTAAGPQMLGLDSFEQINQPRDLEKIFGGVDYTAWRSFRESEDSRYVALTLPRVLGRLPYGRATKAIEEFNFEESVDGTDHSKYLWMNSAWTYAARCTDSFAKHGWFMSTRGVENGGKVEGLPVHTFTAEGERSMKCPTEVAIPDRRENELSNLGFLPLLHCKNTDFAAFLGTQSSQKPKKYFDDAASSNAELSTKFNYIMCVSRFAHYLKVIGRNKIGSFMETDDLSLFLNNWIQNYVLAKPELAGPEMRSKAPLREARVDVQPVKGKPGWFQCVAYLRPHFQLEGFDASMRLVAEIPQKKS